jgi:hypothetical protein
MNRRARLVLRNCLAATAIAAAYPAWAELQVLSSTAPGLKAGTKLSNDAILNIGAGQTVRLLKVESGGSYEVAGPYKGTLDGYSSDCSWWRSLLGKCPNSPNPNEVGATEGATRSMDVERGGTSAGER